MAENGRPALDFQRRPAAAADRVNRFCRRRRGSTNGRRAKAKIDGTNVVVSSSEVPAPVAVRYGWANNPVCDLYNREGLPASPFRTDDWEDVAPPPPPHPAAGNAARH